MMRKPNKASLLNSPLGKDYQLITPCEIITTDVSIVDVGALLRKITWKKGIKFKDIVHSYKNYVKSSSLMGMEITLQRKITRTQGELATEAQK